MEGDNEGTSKVRRKKKLPRFKQYRRAVDLKNPEFRLGMQFENRQVLTEALREYSIIHGRKLFFEKNDKTRVKAICNGGLKYPFVVYASQIGKNVQTFVIKKLSLEHTCGRVEKLKSANPKWICEIFSSKIKRNTYWNLKAFQGEVLESYHVRVSKTQVYRVKKLAKAQIEGNYIQQYARLWDYAEQLKKTNKGSKVKIKCDMVGGEAIFQRIYVCLAACKKGFLEGCRPVIGVDACPLKGPYPGQILTAVGVDGNNGLFPIAYAVAKIENKDSWIWFLSLLIEDLAARATTIPWWEAEMDKMKEEELEAWKWLVQRPPNNWTRSHFHTRYKCDLLLNNLCESFNVAIIDARDNSILTCLESIRMYVMLRMTIRRAACGKWKHPVSPRIFKIIEKNKMGASQCIPRLAGDKMYQVSHMYGGEFVIDLAAMSCSCRRWDLCGIPCAHAISAIFHRDENPVEYVHECYKPETYMRSYQPIVHPIPSMDQWVKGGLPPIGPPFHKRQPGRPKRVRTNEAAEVQLLAPNPLNPLPPGYTAPAAKLRRLFIKIRCGACGKEGHNRRGWGRQVVQAEAAQNGNVGQNEVQAADNGNAGQNDIAPAQTETAPTQTETNAAPTQTDTAPAQIEVIRRIGRGGGRGRGLWNPAARMSYSQPVVRDINQGRANLPMTYSQQVPLQPSSSSLGIHSTTHRGRFKHSVKRGGQV
ncbi:uncharacterized protein LOC110768680 [Prunus avium]|uniref:Uncharacterized protein LOC110768680 n=1 Tax=Prunus avium TaxID=42229 RepID=A0A6P5TKU8_PRUAV|nr:uncharacterized protein LOC110768680 [Prunus avium]